MRQRRSCNRVKTFHRNINEILTRCLLEETELKYEEASKGYNSILSDKDCSIRKLENQIDKLEV